MILIQHGMKQSKHSILLYYYIILYYYITKKSIHTLFQYILRKSVKHIIRESIISIHRQQYIRLMNTMSTQTLEWTKLDCFYHHY